MSERHEFGEPIPAEESSEQGEDGKNPDECVGGQFVGERQRTYTRIDSGSSVRYRIGLDEHDRTVIDRLHMGRFARISEPTRIKLAEVPEEVQEAIRAEVDELRAEHAPRGGKKSKGRKA